MMILTQIIYLKPGQEDLFHEFESIAIPAIARYQGDLLMRLRPAPEQFIEGSMLPPYEVHLVSFPGESEFRAFLMDEQRQKFLHLKDASIQSSLIFKGMPFP